MVDYSTLKTLYFPLLGGC